jgi:high affinity Mn2+ porin
MMKSLFLSSILLPVAAVAQQDSSLHQAETFSVHGQTTVVSQFKPAFKAPYSGTNSLKTDKESGTSLTSTLYLGAKLWPHASLYVNPEIAGGAGLSSVLGLGDATNGETFRVGDPSPKVYLARLFFQQQIPLSDKRVWQEADQNQLAGYVPERYLSFTVGKIGVADFFDANPYSHDPRTQFLCWGLMDNAAWDYAANTRGYTPSVVLEYVSPKNELRYGFSLLPQTANGNVMNWNVRNSHSQTLEYTRHYTLAHREGSVSVLGFYNNAAMGNYRESIDMNPVNPDIIASRGPVRNKFGFGINAAQELSPALGCFVRASWNDGHNETWAFTEVDHSISGGLSLEGSCWHRDDDHAGLAFVTSGLSRDHIDYLNAGGLGFMLGDGKLHYGWEKLTEVYYSASLLKHHVYLSGAYQFIINPGYNKDRNGPVNVFSLRVHTLI